VFQRQTQKAYPLLDVQCVFYFCLRRLLEIVLLSDKYLSSYGLENREYGRYSSLVDYGHGVIIIIIIIIIIIYRVIHTLR
jgi:hypothetical protein